MSYPLNLITIEEFNDRKDAGTRQPGDCYYAPWLNKPQHTSEHFRRDWAGERDPIVVWLPNNGGPWSMDGPSNNGDGWQVTGDVPVIGQPLNLTATPSVLSEGYFHGWLRDGVLVDA